MNANGRKSKFKRSSGRSLSEAARGVQGFRGVWPSGLLFLLSLGLSGTLSAGSLPDAPYVSTSAEAVLEVDPDFAVIFMIWRSVADSAEAAREKADQAQRRLLELLGPYEDAIDGRRIESIRFGEERDYDQARRQQVHIGFYGQFSVELQVHDFERLQGLYYQLAGLEWHSLQNPRFEVDDDESALESVRRQALEKASERARALASVSGASLGAIWGIIHEPMHERAGRFEDTALRRVSMSVAAGEAGFALPLEPRPVRFEARVGVVYRLEPASD